MSRISGRKALGAVIATATALTISLSSAAPAAEPDVEPSEQFTPGESYLGSNGYVEYLAGNSPVIFAAPHGGDLRPATIPNRTEERCGGDIATVKDLNTLEMAREIQSTFFERTGRYPHVIINRLHRSRLDANRPMDNAACGNPAAEQAWTEFQGFIETAKDQVEENHDKGWFTDLHGHGHDVQRLELGYLLNEEALRVSDEELDREPGYEDGTSFRTFSETSPLSLSDLLRGETALGTLFAQAGYPATPSQQDAAPAEGEPFFSGGYNTQRHGCRDGGPICGVQIEHNRIGVRDDMDSITAYAQTLYDVYAEYLLENFDILVASPAEGVDSLRSDVRDLVRRGQLDPEHERGLIAKLHAAKGQLQSTPRAAENMLGAFSERVRALRRSGDLTHADSQHLTTLAFRIVQAMHV